MFFMCQSYEHSTQHCEHISLDECYKHFKTVHEQQHYNAENIKTETISYAHRPTEEDNASETQYHRMACHHVSKRRIIKAKGFVNTPNSSIKGITGAG